MLNPQNSKTTFVTVNPSYICSVLSCIWIQKQLLLLLIPTGSSCSYLYSSNSKTTFVTVNLKKVPSP